MGLFGGCAPPADPTRGSDSTPPRSRGPGAPAPAGSSGPPGSVAAPGGFTSAAHRQRVTTRKERGQDVPDIPRNYDTANFSSLASTHVSQHPCFSPLPRTHQHTLNFIILGSKTNELPLRPGLAALSGRRSLLLLGEGQAPPRPPRHPSTIHTRGHPPQQPVHPGHQLPASLGVGGACWGCFLQKHLAKWMSENTHVPTSPPATEQPPGASGSTSDHLRTENRTPAPRSSPTPEDPGRVSWARQHRPCHPDSDTTLSSTQTRGQDWQRHAEREQLCGARCREAGAGRHRQPRGRGLQPPASRTPGSQQCRLRSEQGTRTFTRAAVDRTFPPYQHAPQPHCPPPEPPRRAAGAAGDRLSRGCPAALTGLAVRGCISFRHPRIGRTARGACSSGACFAKNLSPQKQEPLSALPPPPSAAQSLAVASLPQAGRTGARAWNICAAPRLRARPLPRTQPPGSTAVHTACSAGKARAMCITHRAFFSRLLSTGFFMLYGAVGVKGGIFLPFSAPTLPSAPRGPTMGRVRSQARSRYLKEGWPARPPPLTSLPPHVSRPGGTRLPWEAGAGS